MIYLQKVVIDQNRRSPSSREKPEIRCGMTDTSTMAALIKQTKNCIGLTKQAG